MSAVTITSSLWVADLIYIYVKKLKLPKNLSDLLCDKLESKVAIGGFAALSALLVILGANHISGSDPIGRTLALFGKFSTQEKKRNIKVNEWIDGYNNLHDDSTAGVDGRNMSYTTLVNSYYELATSFYEWGWGECFHFAYKLKNESFKSAIARHEYYLAGRLGVKSGDKVLDCGCGIGGPMRNIARFTRAQVTGITLNEYQVMRGNELNQAAGLDGQALSVKGDFMSLPFSDNSYDGVYAIEATCHAPVREKVYKEIYRVLKPGQVFACYEWCLTPLYNAANTEHALIKKKIEEGDGLPDMASQEHCVRALKSVGFEMIESRDMALDALYGGEPWWLPLHPSYNPFTFRFQLSPLGMMITRNILYLCEAIWLVPSGTYKIQVMLQQGGWGCARGGYTGVFTPMWLMVARKPLK
mmetsp:Transcript_20877/g.20995  ORF Transcript_20877/g.20995 Transcript_20877/m.20995 type:complete len:414 (-) Transcript_20877:86-1327(-)|eukprot:CAMPEP_0182437338 /NCGR_PEP_ID=MMETSP1167-20130531/84881_1 /TAXON_ID=2988 /ORGANISM="Mallomonas Sp, Strain CCMP3275" /LENGTH=413 /DNA_ID=CAMNT_0024630219 /DNA_START=59 /DNA_END=1300 /DNA_ORIENTATION=-